MKKMLPVMWLFVMATLLWSDFQMTDWEYSKPVETSDGLKDGYIKLQIDKDVCARARHDLFDLRIIDNQQREIPYKMVANYLSVQESIVQAKMLKKSFVPGQESIFILGLGEEFTDDGFVIVPSPNIKKSNNRIVINTPERNFKRKVTVSGSPDRQEWLVLKDNGYIFDFSNKNFQSSYTVIDYPENIYQYLKVTIQGTDDKPLETAGITVYSRTIQNAEEQPIACQIISRTADAQLKVSEYILDFGTPGQSQYRLELAPKNENYHRRVEILGSDSLNPVLAPINERYQSLDANKGWEILGNGYIHNFNTPQIQSSRSSVNYSENYYRFIKVRIFDYDDLPLNFADKSITVYGVIHRVIFPVKAGAGYLLYYGNPNGAKAIYDLESLFPYIDAANIAEVKAGLESRNNQYILKVVQKPWSEQHAGLLWVFIGLGIVVLGFIILKWSKSIKPDDAGG